VGNVRPKISKKSEKTDETSVRHAVEALLEQAIARGASDIHFEPTERNVRVRMRIDGWLEQTTKLPLQRYSVATAYLKHWAGLTDENPGAPQSGSIEFDSKTVSTTLTISTMPTMDGEKLVVHLSPQLSEPATLESLGFWGGPLRQIEQVVAEPHGLIVASSSVATGASMSLLGMVHLLNNPALNIATLEEPITQRIASVNQTEVRANAGVPFSTYLQALLKQDPDVVMVSSIQDPATVSVGLEAALSGKLVLGGLHNHSATQAIAHLVHLSNEPFLLAAALRLSVGQRFVRRLCPYCREMFKPDQAYREQLKALLKVSDIKSVKTVHALEKVAAEEGLGKTSDGSTLPLATTETHFAHFWRASEHGCEHCHFKGYIGRIGVCEVLPITESFRKLIASKPSAHELQTSALEAGMIPLQLDAFIKALRGLTSVEEILPLMPSLHV
jgi:type IV pilus assembly protein PilB